VLVWDIGKLPYGLLQFLSFQLTFSPSHLEMQPLEQKSAVIDGIKVVYQSQGKGARALVFIHGWTCNSSLWHLQAPLFQNYRSLLIDLPGHGGSEAPHVENSMELFARAIEAVLETEGMEKAVLLAHSMGGPVSTMASTLSGARVGYCLYRLLPASRKLHVAS
jgi:alpha-beta hydrolase superfamily lysophospholipase